MMQVNKILIPNNPHLDPVAAIWLLYKYGQEKFPDIQSAEIVYWHQGHQPTQEDVAGLGENVMLIDLGGGMFDHHGKENNTATAFSLVAEHLGIQENPELSALISYVREDDLEGLHNRFGDLAYLLKCMYKNGEPVDKVMQTTFSLLDQFQETQRKWHHDVRAEYEEKCKVYKLKRGPKKIKVGIIESDNEQVANFGITTDSLSVVVQRRSTGHVMILTNKHHRIELKEIIGAIRMKELEMEGYDKPLDPYKLRYEGNSTLVPNWFFHRSLNAFMNGSAALSKAEPTKVPFNNIIDFVSYGVSSDTFGLCDCATGGQTCPFSRYGFRKCEDQKRLQ